MSMAQADRCSDRDAWTETRKHISTYEEKANNLQLDVQHASQRLQTATQHFKNTGAELAAEKNTLSESMAQRISLSQWLLDTMKDAQSLSSTIQLLQRQVMEAESLFEPWRLQDEAACTDLFEHRTESANFLILARGAMVDEQWPCRSSETT